MRPYNDYDYSSIDESSFHILSDVFGSQTNSITYILYHIKALFRFLFLKGDFRCLISKPGIAHHVIRICRLPVNRKQAGG